MPKFHLEIPVSEADAAAFAGCDMMVTPLSEGDQALPAQVLEALEATARANWSCVSTLLEVIETKGCDPAHIVKTLHMMQEPNRLAQGQIVFVRQVLGRSALVARLSDNRGTLQ